MSAQDPTDRIVRQTRNRYRLLALLAIYPIYKAVQYLTEGNLMFGIIMGILAAIYLGLIIKFFSSQPGI